MAEIGIHCILCYAYLCCAALHRPLLAIESSYSNAVHLLCPRVLVEYLLNTAKVPNTRVSYGRVSSTLCQLRAYKRRDVVRCFVALIMKRSAQSSLIVNA